MDKNNSTYWKIIRGDIGSAEQLEREIHLENLDLDTAEHLRDIYELQILSSDLSGMHRYDGAEALRKILRTEIGISGRPSLLHKVIQMRLIAASVVFIIGLTAVNFIFFRPANYFNHTDQPVSIVLNDFSEVVLSPHAKLEVNRYYGLFNRKLQLAGSAYFNVSSLPSKAFIVQTSYGDITVLGTRFFILENADQNILQVELKEGKLAIESGKSEKQFLQDSGMATIEDARIRLVDRYDKMDYSWAGEPMVFEDVTVKDIVEEINLRYGYELIGLKEGQGRDCRMHTVVYPGMVEDFIKELQILFDIKLRKYKGTFEIDEVNCNG